jgi:AraC-like DNA-binding protein
MTKAKTLLDSNRNYTIAEVAQLCGFEENSNFTRAFKSFFEITPSQYRKRP